MCQLILGRIMFKFSSDTPSDDSKEIEDSFIMKQTRGKSPTDSVFGVFNYSVNHFQY